MADVSLDDLIKKDKNKGKVDRLKEVRYSLFRNLKARNMSVEVIRVIVIGASIGDPEIQCLTNIDLSKSVSKITVTEETIGTTGEEIPRKEEPRNQDQKLQLSEKREKRSSEH